MGHDISDDLTSLDTAFETHRAMTRPHGPTGGRIQGFKGAIRMVGEIISIGVAIGGNGGMKPNHVAIEGTTAKGANIPGPIGKHTIE
jgi:hypothetical protein